MTHADLDTRDHYAELIDITTFVQNLDASRYERRLLDNTLNRASRDHEWLLYPKDPMPGGPGFSCRFVMNRHLRVFGCFKVSAAP